MGANQILRWFFSHLLEGGASAAITPLKAGLISGASLIIVAVATAISGLLERRRITDYGLNGLGGVSLFAKGSFWGIFFVTLLVGMLYLTHHLTFEVEPATLIHDLDYGLEWFISMLFIGMFEEMLLRGYPQWTLGRGIGFWWAALLLSCAFGAMHRNNPGESPVGIFSAAAIGLAFCLSVWYTRSLWWAIGFHATWDWGETFLYGTPNSGLLTTNHFLFASPHGPLLLSGGKTGPEGSLFVIPTIALVAVVIYFTLRSRYDKSHS